MIRRSALINAIRRCDFTFKRQTDRIEFYKKSGSTQRIAIRRNILVTPEYARIVLLQAGMLHDEIERFIAETNDQSRTH